MESKNELKVTDINSCTWYYFDDIIALTDSDFSYIY